MKFRSHTSKKNEGEDIVKLIMNDHKALKKLIKVMKDDDEEMDAKRDAFEEFAPLLIAHSKPEEQVLYSYLKNIDELRWEGFEGEVEHQIAEQLVDEIQRTDDEDEYCARVKVLAEVVEHHIEEEEDTILPDFKQCTDSEERRVLGIDFDNMKTGIVPIGEFEREDEHDENYFYRMAR